MDHPTFSICIPNFNYGHYIGETIKSVLEQSYQNFEIIVADNVSTDNSVAVVKSFNDERIRLIQNKYNIGFSPNLDRSTETATGDYFILLSSDDLMKPSALEEYNKIISNMTSDNSNLIIMSGYEVIDGEGNISIPNKNSKSDDIIKYIQETGKAIFFDELKNIEIYDGLFILKGLLTHSFQPAGAFLTTCYSRGLYDKVEGYNNIMCVFPDAHFSHKLCFQNPKVVYCNKVLFGYRIHDVDHKQHGNQLDTKILVDLFHISNAYNDEELRKIDLTEQDLRIVFINYYCIKNPFYLLISGRISRAYYNFIFGFASYPHIMLLQPKTYLIFTLFLIAPVFWILGNLYRKFH
jgi:glycosyltransferase involved in cell wall biosynthesis